ncbi:MAG: hypothetical protein JXJ22_17815 [Bacteroidales bacterium]|nr:hypothetical protein [Bacteroidales bacterium]
MKKITTWINFTSITLIILGLIHLAAIIVVAPMYKNLSDKQFSVFVFMYLATGLGTVLPGIIARLQINALENKSKIAWKTLLICTVYTVIIGIGAVIEMTDNPFAYIILIIGISLLIPAVSIKKHIW